MEQQSDPSSKLATEIAEAINSLVDVHEWAGDSPFEVKMVSQKDKLEYIYQLRRGKDWITIQERLGSSPSLVRTFNLTKKEGKWTYVDTFLLKYGKSSLNKLKPAYDRLKIAIEC